jgi:peptidoglycan/xylan/chitin deacetylase (PgdA/CDA1 family)
MRLFRPCLIAGCFYPEALFRIKTAEKHLCLTFDDGPDPDSTPRLLEILEKYNIKALFFCDGRAAEKHPDLVQLIRHKGHQTGNHGFSHLNGWTTSVNKYVTDVSIADKLTSASLFRPPYGHLKHSQYRVLKGKYKIVFWDLMAYDFDTSFGSRNSLEVLKRKIRPGSVIVLHDTSRSVANIIIEEFLNYSLTQGFRFVLF